jgi:hypothetical protein
MKAKKDTKGVQPNDFIMLYRACHTAIRPEKGCYPALLYIAGGKDKLVKANTCLKRRNDTGVKTSRSWSLMVPTICLIAIKRQYSNTPNGENGNQGR